MNYIWASGTHVGRVRENNEDTIFPSSDGSSDASVIVAVADGMGGHAGGEIASSTAMAAATTGSGTPEERVLLANNTVLAKAATTPSLTGMGTTLTLARFTEDSTVEFAHVGDSRAYLFRANQLTQITNDHTLVAEWVAAGAITPEEAKVHPRRGMLMKSLGVGLDVDVETHELSLATGDRLMLCSDGLTGMVEDDVIASILANSTPAAAVWELIEAANNNGGNDNVSVVVIDAD